MSSDPLKKDSATDETRPEATSAPADSGAEANAVTASAEATAENQEAGQPQDGAAPTAPAEEPQAAHSASEIPTELAAGNAAADPVASDPVAGDDVADSAAADDDDEEEEEPTGPVEPIEEIVEPTSPDEQEFHWYILKVQVNREDSIRDALQRRITRDGLDDYFHEIIVPTEDVVEFTKSGKKRTVKRKLFPGYVMVNMALNDDTWFLVRETPGIGDFTGSAGKPTPMNPDEVRRIIRTKETEGEGTEEARIAIPFNVGDRVRVKEGYFQNFEGDVESIDNANGRVTVMINIFGRSTPVELQHWQMERV